MKILLHGINFAPELTGAGKYTGDMADWLATKGHEVRVVTAPPYYPEWRVRPGYSRCFYSREAWREMRVWRCPLWVPKRPSAVKRLAHLFSFAVSSLPVMLRQTFWRPHVVWVAEPTLFCAPTGWLAARIAGARCWLHVQDLEVDAAYELGLLRASLVRRAVLAWERWMMRRFDRVSAVSNRMMERIAVKGVSRERLLFFPNWTDVAPSACALESNSLRVELGLSPDDVVALYSGSMAHKQGLEILAEAATRTRSKASLVFVFCGAGPGREQLVALCDGLTNVRFLDLQPVEQLGALLQLADIHLLPQRADAADLVLPSKLTGMLASGRPVIATCSDDTELASVVREHGLVVPPGKPQDFAEAISCLAADPNLRTRLGNKARTYAERHLSRESVLARFESALEELALR